MGGKPIQLSGLGSSAGGASGASAVLAAASSAGGSSSATPAVSAVTLAGASPPGAAGASGGAGGPRIVYVRKPTPTSVLNSSATGPTPTVMTTTAAAGSPTKAGSKIIFVSNKNQLPGGSPGTRPVAPAGVVKLVSSGSPNAAGGNALPPGLLSSLRPVAVGSSAGAGGGQANAKLKGAPGAPLLLRTVMPKPVTGANAVFQPKAAGGSPAAAAAGAAASTSSGSGGASVPQLPSVPIPKNKLTSAAAAVAGADSGKGSKAPPTSTAVATANNSAPAVDPKMQAMLPKRPIPISQKVAVGGSPPKIIKKVISNSQAGGAPTLIMPAAPVGQPGPPANALPLPAGNKKPNPSSLGNKGHGKLAKLVLTLILPEI